MTWAFFSVFFFLCVLLISIGSRELRFSWAYNREMLVAKVSGFVLGFKGFDQWWATRCMPAMISGRQMILKIGFNFSKF